MSNKGDLQRKLSELGYQIGPFASKDTLSNVIRLHSSALQNTGVDVAKLNDLDLRKTLTQHGLAVGPVTNHTRAIYQRKLLEVLTNEISEGQEDETETDAPVPISISTTPPRATRTSMARSGDNSITSSPGSLFSKVAQEPRIPLTRVDLDTNHTENISSYYPNLSTTKGKTDDVITHSYSAQRSTSSSATTTKNDSSRNSTSNVTYGLRNPYDFQNDEPVSTRHEHKATPFRTTGDTYSTNTNRYTKPTDMPSSTTRNVYTAGNDINEIRARIFGNSNEKNENQINKDLITKKPSIVNEPETKKSVDKEKLDMVVKGTSNYLYPGITIAVALVVFVLYLWLA